MNHVRDEGNKMYYFHLAINFHLVMKRILGLILRTLPDEPNRQVRTNQPPQRYQCCMGYAIPKEYFEDAETRALVAGIDLLEWNRASGQLVTNEITPRNTTEAALVQDA